MHRLLPAVRPLSARRSMLVAPALALLAALSSASPAAAQRRRPQPQPQQQPAQPAAQPAPPAATPEQTAAAREAYGRGQAAFTAGNYPDAIAAFQAAFAAIPNPVVLLPLAQAQERQGDFAGLVATLERYLSLRADAPDRAQQEQRIAAARARPGTLHVVSTPPGAAIAIDGTATGRVTPADVEVPPGDHTVALSLEGYEAGSQSVSVTFGSRADVQAELTALPPPPEEEAPPAEETVEPPAEEPAPAAPARREPSVGVWVTAGIAGATLIGGSVMGYLALSSQSDFDARPSKSVADQGEVYALVADVLFVAAGVSAITSLVLWLTQSDPPVAARAGLHLDVAPVLTPSTAGLALSGQF